MTNKKIVQEGIVTPQIDLGDQAASSTIIYDSGSDTVTINSSLTVSGTSTTVDTVDLLISDNMISLNVGEAGSGVGGGAGFAGLEIDRGLLDNARMFFNEATNEWRFAQADGTNTRVATSGAPINADHLTNKSYVDTEITNAVGTVDELREMTDVDIDDVPGGLPPAWVMPSGGWDGYSLAYDDASSKWMARLIPPGIAYLEIQSPNSTIDFTPAGAQNGGTTYTLDLADIGTGAGSHVSADITVDAQGRVTAAADGDIFQTITADGGAPYPADGVDSFKVSGGVGLGSTIDINGTVTVNLDNTAVTPGLYTLPTITVDQQGRITLAANGSIDVFKQVNANIGTSPVAGGPADHLNIVGGTGMTTYGDAGSDTITVTLDNTAVSAGSYTAADITINAQGQITAASNGAISTGEIENLAVTDAKLATNAVTNVKMANNAVNTNEITDDAVTVAKIGHATGSYVLQTSSGGAPAWVGNLRMPNGSAALPSYSFANDTNSGMYHVGNNILGWSTGGANKMTLSSGGDLTVTGNVTAFSDITLKTDINVIENALDKVMNIDGVTFKRIDGDDDTTYVGVVAQNVEKYLPEAVVTNDEGIKSVAYGNMVGLLIEAIKDQQKQIDELKAKLGE